MARLSRIVKAGAEHDPIEIDFRNDFIDYKGGPISCIKAKAVNPSYDVYLAVIPGVALCELYEEFGSRLLELNVQVFLAGQRQSQQRDEIRCTLSPPCSCPTTTASRRQRTR